MGKGSKKLYWAGAGTAFLLVLLLALAVIVPRLVDSAWLKETIQAEAAQQVNGKLDFQKADISILPFPSVALQQVSLIIPKTAQINLDTIRVYPKLLPLLIGNIELNEIVIDRPDFSLPLPEKSGNKPEQGKTFSLSETLETASTKLLPILSAIPGLKVGAHKGTLRLIDGNEQIFLFENIESTFDVNTKNLTATISCGSNIWESMELKASFAPGSMQGQGKISLENTSNKPLADYILSGKPSLLDGSFSSLQVNFSVNQEDGLTAHIKSSNFSFTALSKDKKVTAKVENLKGSLQYSDQISAITVDDLSLSYPQLQLSGSFKSDRSVPQAGLDIKSQNTDITGVQEVLPVFIAAFFGDLPIVQQIFDIVKGGTISQASFHVAGNSLEDLAEFDSMLIKGNVKNAAISLADLGLDLHSVTGDVVIANGILEGKNLQAKLGNTTGSNGTLKLGLVKKETTPFHLDLDLIADLSEVPLHLKKLLPNENVQHYLSLFEIYEGTAHGRLTLGESLESLKVRAEADNIITHIKYEPIPFPVTIEGGRIIYDELTTESHDLQGKIGRSTFSNYSSHMNFAGEPSIEILSGIFHIVLDEIFPWLATSKKLEDDLNNITKLTGIADLTITNIKGPVFKPADMQYEVQGALESIALNATTLPGVLNIKSGQATIKPDEITLIDIQADLLDSSLLYSGVLKDFLSGKTKAEVIVTDATIGNELNTWFTEQIKTPKEYIFRTPLLISRASAKWTRDELLDLQGDFSIKNGPIFSVDLMLNPDEFILRNLFIQNGTDRAKIALDLKKRAIGAEFQGSLSQKTIDKIMLHKEAFPDAWIKGDINFQIDMDSLTTSTASGKLDGGEFIVPLKLDKPLLLESFKLTASDKTISINSVQTVFENHNFSISGTTSLAGERLSMDLGVKTDTIELDKILEVLPEKEKEKTGEGKKVGKSWDLAIDAAINLHADTLHYNGYTWEPFESQITFANNYLGIEVVKAELCSLSTPGKISFHEGKISLDFQMETSGQELQDVLICLEGGDQQMTGTLDLKINISAYGTKDTLANSLQGNLQFSAKDGFIYQDARAAKLLSFLNVTSMFQGKIPDLRTTGFNYDYLIVKGDMKNGILEISPAKLDAPIMEIVSHGTIDIPKERVDLQVLVAPLQMLNKIQNLLPIIRKIIPGSLVAVPVEVSGDFSDIKVRALSMSAIGKNVFGVMVDALSTPVRVLKEKPEK